MERQLDSGKKGKATGQEALTWCDHGVPPQSRPWWREVEMRRQAKGTAKTLDAPQKPSPHGVSISDFVGSGLLLGSHRSIRGLVANHQRASRPKQYTRYTELCIPRPRCGYTRRTPHCKDGGFAGGELTYHWKSANRDSGPPHPPMNTLKLSQSLYQLSHEESDI